VASDLKQLAGGPRRQLLGLLEKLEDEAVYDVGLRSSMRRAVHTPVTLGVIAGGYKPLYRGWATDLSLNGLGLLTEHDVPMGALLYVNLEAVAEQELLLAIRVCYVRQLMSKTYRIGGTFSFPADDPGHARLFN
jgi:PilZ domain